MNFAVLRRPRTEALLDGTVRPDGLPVRWRAATDPLGWSLPPQEKHRDLALGELAGGEMSLSSFIQARSRGAPLAALPIFLKRGLVQRSLFCSVDSHLSSPEQLAGKKVGLVGHTTSMAVWMRGILSDGYGFGTAGIQWFTLSGSFDTTRRLQIPDDFSAPNLPAWEELDGYVHRLDRRESFLFSLLDRGELDAVISFQARIDDARTRPLLDAKSLWALPLNSRIYPINHLFVVKTDLLNDQPAIAATLLSAFRDARRLWNHYQTPEEREIFDGETAQLGYDPFAYRLGEVEKATLETFVGYLEQEKLTSRKLELDELFYSGL